jgi:hypothetical protein
MPCSPSRKRYGMGILVCGPLGQGKLTGRVRRGQDTNVRRAKIVNAFSDDRRLDAVERLVRLAEEANAPNRSSATAAVRHLIHTEPVSAFHLRGNESRIDTIATSGVAVCGGETFCMPSLTRPGTTMEGTDTTTPVVHLAVVGGGE